MAKTANVNRRGAYAFYRSIGYTPAQARNMRNRSIPRVIEDYKQARAQWDDKRIAEYKGDIEKPEKREPPPHRPHMEFPEDVESDYRQSFEDRQLPEHIIDQMFEESDAFDIEIYDRRIDGLAEFFAKHDQDWDALMDAYGDIEDLGDWFDFLGELYDELKG